METSHIQYQHWRMPSLVRPIARHTYGWNAQMQPSKYHWSAKCESDGRFPGGHDVLRHHPPHRQELPIRRELGDTNIHHLKWTKNDNPPVIKSWCISGCIFSITVIKYIGPIAIQLHLQMSISECWKFKMLNLSQQQIDPINYSMTSIKPGWNQVVNDRWSH